MSTLTEVSLGFGDDVVARDPVMLQVLQTAQTLARHKAAVVITGETGSGKEVVARILHRYSDRSSRPWIDVNCAALPEHLVESELFGHEKGAFSGADTAKPGLFEMANGGTLFLDEIGEIDPRVQVKLLRVLDSVPFYRLGGTRKVSVDVRLIAATNRDLDAAVRAGTFRHDLYHRITEFHIPVPPLRTRPLDIIALATHFLSQLKPDQHFTEAALELMTLLNWPGNVRELRNFVTRLAVSEANRLITADDVRQYALGALAQSPHAPGLLSERATSISEMERLMILHALRETGGNQTLAAQQLGIPRRTFCRKLNEYKITLGRHYKSRSRASGSLANFRAELRIPLQIVECGGPTSTAYACDLSLGGIGVCGVSSSLEVSREITLNFTLPDQDLPIEVPAAVAWLRPDGTAGLRFTRLSNSARDHIRRWLCNSTQPELLPATSDFQQPLTA